MADVDFDEFDGGYGTSVPRAGRMSHLVHLAGATCSVALVIGLAVWGYKLAVRDVSGVPVVRAMEGPMRIAPENPGGEVADHQAHRGQLVHGGVHGHGLVSILHDTARHFLANDHVAGQ